MIYIEFLGKTNKRERHLIGHVLNWVSIRFIKNLNEIEKIEGDVDYEDDELKPRDFTVRLNKGILEEHLITLVFHKLVHIKQYLRKELVYKFDTKNWGYKTYFKGRDVTNLKYYDQPFGKEAYRLQEKLYDEYIKRK